MAEDLQKNWYVVNTYAGMERRVKENLERRIKTMGLEDTLFQVLIAETKEIETNKDGKTVEKMHNLFDGYILVQMRMTDEAWYVVRNTPGVTGFIGSSGKGAKPFPVPQEEIDNVLRQMGQVTEVTIDFAPGDQVEIIGGPFEGDSGKVISLDQNEKTASVSIRIFGRETETDIPFADLKKKEEEF